MSNVILTVQKTSPTIPLQQSCDCGPINCPIDVYLDPCLPPGVTGSFYATQNVCISNGVMKDGRTVCLGCNTSCPITCSTGCYRRY